MATVASAPYTAHCVRTIIAVFRSLFLAAFLVSIMTPSPRRGGGARAECHSSIITPSSSVLRLPLHGLSDLGRSPVLGVRVPRFLRLGRSLRVPSRPLYGSSCRGLSVPAQEA